MNFVFISPQFPKSYWNFCDRLKKNGVNVLGIGDTPYDALSPELRGSLTEYYKVNSLENYDEKVRAMGYFIFKYVRSTCSSRITSTGWNPMRRCERILISRPACRMPIFVISRQNRQ